ncbi:restriction endonuclease subunit S [Acidithiobacillus albertensis]|uniref:restriction endonuclease subunit S n=1 Tax=Acidithiobacillus albertensis TaxID=119978 RepID=UPI000AA830B8|nr:restriction endonuclease subunit S [Acidithiobacillus albertensis]
MSSTDPRPQLWETVPLRYVCKLNPSVAFDGFDEDEDITFLPMDRVKSGYFIPNTDKFSKYGSSYTAFEDGDIVLAKVTPCFENGNIAIAANLVGGKGFGSSELFVIRPIAVERRFLFYYFQSSIFKQDGEASMTGAGGLKRVSPDVLRQHHLPCPSQDIQHLIANYLDHETARIDALIAEKERMLALLEEKRATLISRVVTRSLDLNAPLKPSGQEWLGDIPAHWPVERTKNLFTVRDERSDDGTEELLTVSHITGVTSRSEKDVYMFEADDKAGYKRCMPGDLAINTLWAWMGAMGISPLAGIVSPDYHVYTSKGQLLPEYVDLLCRSRPFIAEVNRWSKGVWSSRLRLYPENFFEMRLPVPPHDEQLEIVRSVEADQTKANALRDSLQLSITLAKERRAALITAAVTGQIAIEDMKQN